jgi:hypothetical protein
MPSVRSTHVLPPKVAYRPLCAGEMSEEARRRGESRLTAINGAKR